MTMTFAEALGRHSIQIPPHLEAQAEIPVVTSGHRQGDIYVRQEPDLIPAGKGVLADGVKIVQGDADRNSHILDGGRWHPGVYRHEVADYGAVVVAEGEACTITHTGEHGSIALAPGVWRVWGQLDYAAELRRAAD